MSRFKGLRNALFAAAGALLMVAAAAPVSAATPPQFQVSIGDNCVRGMARPNASMHLVWKDADGAVKANQVITVTDIGEWVFCARATTLVASGDRLRATIGSTTRTFTVPQLSIRINRETNIKGTGPAGASLKVYCGSHAWEFEPCTNWSTVIVNGKGKWSLGWRFAGGESTIVRWRDAMGDRVDASATAPFVIVTLDKPRFLGVYHRNSTATVQLFEPSFDGLLAVGRAAGAATDGSFVGKLRDPEGRLYATTPGDHMLANIGPNADWFVPDIDATASAATQIVSGECVERGTALSGGFKVQLYRNGRFVDSVAHLWDPGPWEFNWNEDTSFSSEIRPGDKLTVMCEIGDRGDWAQRVIFAQ